MRQRLVALLSFHGGGLLGVGAALLSLCLLGAFVTDDAAITLRYAANLAFGKGILWNPGEHPVEGYTNFSHVVLGAAAIQLGLPPLSSLRIVNQASLLLLCALVYLLAFHALRARLPAAASAVWVGLHAPLAYWASSGLETALYTASIYGGILATLRLGSPRKLWPAFAMLAAALSRLEGPLIFGVVVACIALSAVRARSLAPLWPHLFWIATFLALYLGYFGWRYDYFGYLLSNSAYFKLGDPNGSYLIEQFATQNAALLLLALFADWKRLGTLGPIVAAMTVAYLGVYYGVRDSIAYFHRFFLPVVPGLAILAASALQRLWTPAGGQRPRRALAGALFVLVLGFDVLHPDSGFAPVWAEGERLNTRIVSRAQVARFIAERSPPDLQVAAEDVGVIGFVLPNPILDLLGLNDERFIHVFARSPAYVRTVIAQKPGFVVVVSRAAERLRPKYAEGRIATESSIFRQHYVSVAVIRSPAEHYHYWIFARRDLQHAAPARRLVLRAGLEPAPLVDDLFRRVRR